MGRDIEDGSTERLLVAAVYDSTTWNGDGAPNLMDTASHTNSPTHGSRARSPSTSRESSLTSSLTNLAGNLNINLTSGNKGKVAVSEIQRLLGDAVNNLVKYYHRPIAERGSVTLLLCGELGLVPCLEMAYHYGFRSSRIFSKNIFLWDFLSKLFFPKNCQFILNYFSLSLHGVS